MTLERALSKATTTASALIDAWLLNPHPRISAVINQLPASELFAGLFDGKQAEVAQKLAALEQRRHPQLSTQLERILREPPWSSNTSRSLWKRVFTLVAESRDPRFTALAKELPAKWAMRSDQKDWLTSAFTKAVKDLPAPVELTEAQSKLLYVIEREAFSAPPPLKRSATVDFAAVYAAPGDDPPRLVLADALMELGDHVVSSSRFSCASRRHRSGRRRCSRRTQPTGSLPLAPRWEPTSRGVAASLPRAW